MHRNIISYIQNFHDKIVIPEDVGLDAIPDQIRKISIVEGFNINILVIGRRGLGTTTLINSLFLSPLIDSERDNTLCTFNNEIYENDICLKTSITTYHDNDVDEVIKFIDSKNSEYFEAEQGLSRPRLDTRIHLTIYLLPTDSLTKLEIDLMKKVSMKNNLIPIISKADSFTTLELEKYKQKINFILDENFIKVFKPIIYKEDDQELSDETNAILQRYPLAIYSSISSHEFNGEIKRGRLYSWGFLDLENELINDFTKLRKLVISNNMDDLINITDTVFYNEYRKINMESERIDLVLKERRINRIKIEMEKIIEERRKRKLERMNLELEELRLEIEEDFELEDEKEINFINPNTGD